MTRRRALVALFAGAGLGLAAASPPADDLKPPTILAAAGKPIAVEVGHAAPFVGDLDGDGKPDLLVGQFGDGKLRVYRNIGDRNAPRFDAHAWFLDDKPEGRVPSG